MARDLLTPDEVKQLHYKTIIFPIIGYPIFRDIVMYNKFSCYESGEIERKITSLKILDSAYFTVEQIKEPLGGSRFKKINDNLNYEYKQINNKTYSVVSINKEITEVEKSMIDGQLDNNIYHIEIDNNSDGKSIIEIHLKNIYSLEHKLGEKNV